MTKPLERVQSDLKGAMKAGERERLACLRLLLTDLKNEQIRAGKPVDEERFIALVRRAVKQRREAAELFRRGGREETAAQEEREADLLGVYLPAQADEQEIRAAVGQLVASEGLSGPAAMGRIMKAMMQRFGAGADGRTINRVAREVLAEKA